MSRRSGVPDRLEINAVYSECAPTLEPGPAVVLEVEGVTPEGANVNVRINLPASGVQSLRRDLRKAVMAIPTEYLYRGE